MPRRLLSRLLPGVLAAGVLMAGAAAQPVRPPPPAAPSSDAARRQLEDIERARTERLAAQREAAARAAAASETEKHLAEARAATAARLREAETATLAVAHRIDALAQARREAEDRLKARAADLAPLLPVVERLSMYPTETLLAAPGSPEDAVRGVLVMNALSHQIESEAEALRHAQEDAEQASRALGAEMPNLAAAEAVQAAQARELDRQIASTEADRRNAVDAATVAARQAAEEAARAETLRAVLSSLEAERRAADRHARPDRNHQPTAVDTARQHQLAPDGPGTASLPAGAAPHGQLTTPVAGTVLRGWGATTDTGPTTGITYRVPPAAHVVSMCGGRVVFAAPFRSYGLLLIIDCGGGYHAVTAGYQALNAQVGQLVRAGEPVGTMPGWTPGKPGPRPALYVELRRDGQAIDPTPWLKASG